ncbi:efflux RND transporter permease subunit [Sphingomonas sp. So64.6b]|uniref:efflux RND transporter permease subunit n=1 Tax=Sphingomonas sp. So64.6b TaxID=2997354 RepID=UPI001603EB28|nr:efflux RND transporter permease subunit [Sphingomonas sp. So64.6b]QNA84806.1 efflux RND transporter permease subunit [Sphingomonas sp. So64.6b]
MNLTAFAVRQWQVTLVAFLLLAMLGISAFLSIPRSVDPHFPGSLTVVTVVLPGADAAEMEETVAKPIEDVLQGLDDVREIRSTSSDGTAVVSVDFVHGTDAEQALDRTVREVQSIRDRLPQGIQRIAYRRPRTTEAAVLQLALVSDDASWLRMTKYAEDMRDRLNVVPGVRQTVIDGAARPEVRVAVDAARLAETRIAASAIANAIRAGGVDLPAGTVNSGERRLNIDAGGAYRTLEAVRDVPVRAGDGQLLRVGDVASVGWSEAEQLHIARFNGKRALFVSVRQKDNVDAGTLRDALVKAVDGYRTQLPPDIRLEVAFDQSRDIAKKLSLLARDFAIALALVLITILPLGLRPSLIVMISIPLSLAMGVLLLSLFGYTLNQISISGFILSLGLLVDDSIVVTENIERHIRDGDPPETAAITATQEITKAVLGATGVLLFAFLPLCFLPEGSGDFVRGLPMAVILTVASSLVVSLTVIPFAASRMLKAEKHGGNRLLQAITNGIERIYSPVLHRALDAPRRWFWGAMLVCVGAFALVPVLGFTLFPAAEAPYFLVRVETPEGSGIATTDRAVKAVSAILAREPEIVNRMDNAGRGNPQIYYNILPREERARYGDIFVTLKDWNAHESPRMLARLRKSLADFPDAHVSVVNFENGPPLEAPVAIRVSGPDLDMLKKLSNDVVRIMQSVPGLRDIDNPMAFDRIDLDLGLDDAKAGLLGVAPGEPRRAVRLAVSGEQASLLRDAEGDSWPVTVRLPMGSSQPISVLKDIYVPTIAGGSIPLTEIASPTLKSVPPLITRLKLQRTVTITAFNQPGYLASRLNPRVVEKLKSIKLPDGYAFAVGGEAEAAQRNFAGLGSIILLAVFGIIGVLVLEFGRFRETLVVAGVVPLGLVGGLVGLFLTGNSLSFLAIIGFVALIGIEIKNSILLVDFTTQLRARGLPLREAIERAGEIRFLPVLLTSVTAIGGLLPLALSGSSLYSPLAWVIIGGLISSTVLSRIITPVMYLLAVRGDEARRLARLQMPA